MPKSSSTDQPLLQLLDQNRLLILRALWTCDDPLCGCDMVEQLEIPKNLLSYHLRRLREAGFIEEARCGRRKQYRILDDRQPKVRQLLEIFELI